MMMKKTRMMTMVMQKTVGEDYVDDDDADENDDNDYDEKIKGRGARTAAPIRRNDRGRGRDTTLSGWVCSWEGDTQ